jgi:hypothetical protein
MDTGKMNPKTEGLSWIYLGVCRGILGQLWMTLDRTMMKLKRG